MSGPNVVAPNNSDCPGCGDVAEPRCIRDAKDCKTCCWCGRDLFVPDPPPSVDSVKDQLLAMARNVRACLQKAVDYDDEVATIYNAMLFAIKLARGAQGRAGGEGEQDPWEALLRWSNEQDPERAGNGPLISLNHDGDDFDRPASVAVVDGSAVGEGTTANEAARDLCAKLGITLPAPPSPTPGGEKEAANGVP